MASKHFASTSESRGRRSLLWVIPAAIVGVIVVAYLVGVAVFSTIFLPSTTLNGKDVSLKGASDAASAAQGDIASYSVEISGDGLDFTCTASDLGITRDGEAYAKTLLSQQNAWAWPVEVYSSHTLSGTADVDVDAELVAATLTSKVQTASGSTETSTTASASDVSFDAEKGVYTLSSSTLASHIDTEAAATFVAESLASLPKTIQLGDESLSGGSALSDALSKLNSYVAATLTLNLGGQEAAQVTAEQISGWLTLNSDLSVTLDSEAIATWCHGDLSTQLDSVGTTRNFTTPAGKAVTVTGGIYGWSIDGGELANLIVAALEAGQPTTIDIPTTSEAAKINPGGQDWGDRYIDVDVTAQHATFWDNGTIIWEADVVTGQPSEGHDTPHGVWSITSRETGDINLRGPVGDDGEPEWDSHVQFWMGVVGSSVGFHNAPWRTEFGGSIYTWYGSHGCINLSYERASALYDVIQVGDVCVVHD